MEININSENMPTSHSEEPLQSMTSGHIFGRLQYTHKNQTKEQEHTDLEMYSYSENVCWVSTLHDEVLYHTNVSPCTGQW